MMEAIVAIITAIITATVTLLVEFKAKRREISEVRSSFNLPVQVPVNDKRNSTLLLGLGGTGKTSLIKALLNNDEANPNEKTENFEIYKGDRLSIKEKNENGPNNTRYWFYIADYKGQNIGQLVRSFIIQQKKAYSPLAYGHVTSLVLIVDLVAPKKESDSDEPPKRNNYDEQRVNLHLAEWNDTALDAIFGLLTSELRYVNIFINKVDLMTDRSYDAEERYTNIYKSIHEKVKRRSGRATVKTYLGSARDGTSVNYLVEDLMEYSVHNKKVEELANA